MQLGSFDSGSDSGRPRLGRMGDFTPSNVLKKNSLNTRIIVGYIIGRSAYMQNRLTNSQRYLVVGLVG